MTLCEVISTYRVTVKLKAQIPLFPPFEISLFIAQKKRFD